MDGMPLCIPIISEIRPPSTSTAAVEVPAWNLEVISVETGHVDDFFPSQEWDDSILSAFLPRKHAVIHTRSYT